MKKLASFSLFALFIIGWLAFNTIKTPETKVQLGEKLFFDKILSSDKTISCASCHRPEFAFSDTVKFSVGVRGQLGARNAPTCMNMSARPYFFHDGRAVTLQEQVLQPIQNPVEMDLKIDEAVARLKSNKEYKKLFKKIYKKAPDADALSDALSAYIFTLESPGDSPNDLWLNDTDPKALSESQIRGKDLFLVKAKCFECHFSPDFTGDEFRNIGTYNGKELNDVGRYGITKEISDLGKFKVPGLRNIAVTGPYMHNGMFKTLDEVIEFYNEPNKFVKDPINIDTLLQKPLNLSQEEKTDLKNFLLSLTDKKFQ